MLNYRKLLAGILPAWLASLMLTGLTLPTEYVAILDRWIATGFRIMLICISMIATSEVLAEYIVGWLENRPRKNRRRPKGLLS